MNIYRLLHMIYGNDFMPTTLQLLTCIKKCSSNFKSRLFNTLLCCVNVFVYVHVHIYLRLIVLLMSTASYSDLSMKYTGDQLQYNKNDLSMSKVFYSIIFIDSSTDDLQYNELSCIIMCSTIDYRWLYCKWIW